MEGGKLIFAADRSASFSQALLVNIYLAIQRIITISFLFHYILLPLCGALNVGNRAEFLLLHFLLDGIRSKTELLSEAQTIDGRSMKNKV
jgi:hypothetical protein